MPKEFKQFGLKISTKDDYILVEPTEGVDFLEIIYGLSKLLSMPEFKEKNDIWIFREGKLNITYTDLYKIKDYIKKNFPKFSEMKKTAIVVETGLQRSLAELYAKLEAKLQHEICVFSDLNSAEEWIIKPE